MELPVQIRNKSSKLFELCLKYNIDRLFVFGSAANGNFNSSKSDLDLLVELSHENPVEKGESLMNFWTDLEQLFARKVDLLTTGNIRNPYLEKEVETTKQLIYDRADR